MMRYAPGRGPLQTDGGRRTPGVPDTPDEDERTEPRDAETSTSESESTSRETTASGRPMPGVPATGEDPESNTASTPESSESGGECGSGDHGEPESEHELTTAITVRALERTRDPGAVVADARTWSDWVGVVGETSGPELNAFFRTNAIDVDFFNDVSDGPAERLAAIDEGHHFYSPRRVLVGLPEEKEWAEAAGWEFQPFAETAESAGWALEEE